MSKIRLLPPSGFLLVLLSSTGCQDAAPPEADFTVRDSAGIQIVESSAPLLGPDEVWTISLEPVLQIGEREGKEPYLFIRIPFRSGIGMGGVCRLNDGRIVVANGLDRTVRFFDEKGVFISQFGRDGEGPGEFSSDIDGCIRFGTDLGVVERNGVSLFDVQGRFLEKIRLGVGAWLRI